MAARAAGPAQKFSPMPKAKKFKRAVLKKWTREKAIMAGDYVASHRKLTFAEMQARGLIYPFKKS